MELKKLIFVVSFVLLILVVGFMILARKKSNLALKGGVNTEVGLPSPTMSPLLGDLILKTSDGLLRKAQDELLVIDVVGNSENKDIVGYDILLTYPKSDFDVVALESTEPSYRIFKKDMADGVIVTGTKLLSENAPNLWSSQSLVRFTLKPKNKGNFVVSILGARGQDKTKLIDSSSKVFYPTLSKVTVEIY